MFQQTNCLEVHNRICNKSSPKSFGKSASLRLIADNLSAACADKSSYSAVGTPHPYHISSLTHQSLTIAFMLTLTLLTIPLQLPANMPIWQAWM